MKMQSNKIYQIGFLALILINAVLIYLLFQSPERPPRRPGGQRGSMIEKISAQLELDDEQMTKYRSMANQHGAQMRSYEIDQGVLVKAYFKTFSNNSSVSADSIKEEILKIESEKLQYTYDHFEELKSILNEEQKSRFDLVTKDIINVLINERSRRRPPRRP